jgi:hypothetical protein
MCRVEDFHRPSGAHVLRLRLAKVCMSPKPRGTIGDLGRLLISCPLVGVVFGPKYFLERSRVVSTHVCKTYASKVVTCEVHGHGSSSFEAKVEERDTEHARPCPM